MTQHGSPHTSTYVAAENAFNRKYEYFPGYEMPGIMFYIGTKIRF